MRPSLEECYIHMAMVVAVRSTCIRRAVGCVLSNHRGHVIGTGYNGVAASMRHCNEGHPCKHHNAPPGKDKCEAIHAEVNALLQCPNVWDIETAYVTLSPCVRCTKMLLNTGCKRIVFADLHTGETGQELWERAGREWIHYDANSYGKIT